MKECHYPDELIKNCFERAKAPFTNSNELTGLEEDTLVFVSTYIPNLSFDENYILKQIEGVQTKRLKQAFNNTKIIFAKRKPKNLKQLLTSSTFSSSTPQPTEIGMKHCGDKSCLLCRKNYLQLTDKIISPVGKLLFTIKCSFLCKSKNILYYMTCTICGKDYVGQTNDFRKRINNHKSDISGQTNDFRKRMNNHKSDIRGTPTKDTIPVDKRIHYCQLNTHQTFKDPYFHVIPFLTVKDDKRCEDLEIY